MIYLDSNALPLDEDNLRGPDKPINFAGLERLPDFSMKDLEDMLRPFIRKRNEPIYDFFLLKQDSIHPFTFILHLYLDSNLPARLPVNLPAL